MNQLAGVQANQLAVLLLIIRHDGVGEAFESGAEGVFGAAGPVGDSAEFALVAGEEADDEVGFAEGVSLEDKGFARASGHGGVFGNSGAAASGFKRSASSWTRETVIPVSQGGCPGDRSISNVHAVPGYQEIHAV